MRIVMLITLSAFCMSFLTGCNTFKGVGKDVENAGKSVQKTVDRND